MKRAAIVAVVAVAILLIAVVGLKLAVRPPPRFSTPQMVSIRPGAGFAAIARELERAGVVRNAKVMIVYGELTGLAAKVKPGEYGFSGGEPLTEVLRHLVNGDVITVVVAIPEGLTIHQIGQRLAAAGLVCASDFDAAALDGPLPKALGLGVLGTEGFLFPATYRLSPRARVNDVLAAMLARFYAVLTPAVEQRLFALGLDARQLVTLASIVEREAKVPGERPVIAGVFYNRLALGMPLQSDPTAQYNFTGERERPLVAVHAASAFNTYTIAGLPPGPIANPGLSSIEAALYPVRTDYLYFVARNDGTHVFSRSFKEHEHAVAALRHASAACRATAK